MRSGLLRSGGRQLPRDLTRLGDAKLPHAGTMSPLLTVRQVAERLRVHEQTVRKWLYAGELRCYRLGRGLGAGIRISEAQLSEFLSERECPVR